MKDAQLKRIGMFSGIPLDGSDAPLQSSIVEFNPDSMKTITPSGGSSGSGIDQGELFPEEGVEFAKDQDKGLPQDGGGNADGGGTPDPEQPGGESGDGEDFELVKEKPGKQENNRRRKIVRLALLAGAVFIAYGLFFKKR